MALLFIGLLMIIVVGSATRLYVARMRLLNSGSQSHMLLPDADRYRPMLRLLSDADLEFAAANPVLRGKIRTRRREIFRGYLRCLTIDYARLLSGLRGMMAESEVDRPDLAKALARNQVLFAISLCRVEFHLQLHAFGVGRVDVSGLVEALDALRGAVSVMRPATGAAY